jgi:CO/xanthine dehydrogenase FAD-binding subunit
MGEFIFKTPDSVDELVENLRLANENTFILGGGTDFVIQMKKKRLQGTIIDMTGIRGLDEISIDDNQIKIGANVTYSQLYNNPIISTHAACLAQMAIKVGSKQIQNMARLPGNIANASKAGDSIPALIALDASAKIINGKGEVKFIKVQDIILGMGKTILNRDEAIIEIVFPKPLSNTRSSFGKIGHGARNELTIANVSMAMVAAYNQENKIIERSCLVIGAVAPVAFHAVEAEVFLQSKNPTRLLMTQLADLLQQQVEAVLKGNASSKHKINDMHGLAFDVFEKIFSHVI